MIRLQRVFLIGAVALLALGEINALGRSVDAGRGIGKLHLGQSRATVLRDMGRPDQHYALPDGVSADFWGSATRTFYRQGVLVQISITSLVDPLPGGITMTSSIAQVKARHPAMRHYAYTVHGSGGGLVDYYDDQAKGIAFEFTRAMTPQPGEDARPKMYAVLIHRAGVGVIPDTGETPANE